MTQIVNATFDGGSFRPDDRINLTPQSRVRLTVEPLTEAEITKLDALQAFDKLCDDLPIDSHGSRLTRDELHERD